MKMNSLDMKGYTAAAAARYVWQYLKMQEGILFKIIGFCIITKQE